MNHLNVTGYYLLDVKAIDNQVNSAVDLSDDIMFIHDISISRLYDVT